ncbi:uracil-DNA glycosylase family protein [Profundibacterium mesophilum]|uniref:Uracil-DNA glycosylase n=1 Tax=Profundibacterium mesophilum KAUST100406-0324 TaxID=1037889 RepID=A0A921NVY6_9RHOB|nr:uracil-DNA glycosylase family protein [Profundibacterium mesophilum]KAF0676653.1 uracil-DNA glycosylase [Profundibacterium mesophilum KAUST100406-0324]
MSATPAHPPSTVPPEPGQPDPSGTDADLPARIARCRICAGRFAATATAHSPNPVVWFRPGARIVIASQAPGLQVHKANTPFWDRSGTRLREWLGIDEAVFYDRERVSILPSAFCFPGYNAAGSDLPPPPVCAATWHADALAYIGTPRLRVLVGGYAHRLHLGLRQPVTRTVMNWREHAPGTFVLPHPSWRNNAWLKANPWFAAELLPELRQAVRRALEPD